MIRVKCSPDDIVGYLNAFVPHTDSDPSKIQLKKWYVLSLKSFALSIIVFVSFPTFMSFDLVQLSSKHHHRNDSRNATFNERDVYASSCDSS